MIPVERVTELLRLHSFDPSSSLRDCLCGWQEGDDYHGSHASHVAGVLADAGLIPTTQEWGVRYQDRHHGTVTKPYPEDVARRSQALLVDPKIANHRPDAHIVTRWSGATAWTAEEEQE